MKTINVKQDEYVATVVLDDETRLTSGGIGPCICIMAKGKIGDNNYIAMHHWSGFSCPKDHVYTEIELKDKISQLFLDFSLQIACQLAAYEEDPEERLILDKLYLVGGQTQENDSETGELLVSGTELEAQALLNYTEIACNNCFQTCGTEYNHNYHDSSGSDDLRVFFSCSSFRVEKNSGYITDEEENDGEEECLSGLLKRPRCS